MSHADEVLRAALQSRLRQLRGLSFAVLAALPHMSTEYADISGIHIRFTILHTAKKSDGSVEFIVRSDRKIVFGLLWKGISEGFSMLPEGRTETTYISNGWSA